MQTRSFSWGYAADAPCAFCHKNHPTLKVSIKLSEISHQYQSQGKVGIMTFKKEAEGIPVCYECNSQFDSFTFFTTLLKVLLIGGSWVGCILVAWHFNWYPLLTLFVVISGWLPGGLIFFKLRDNFFHDAYIKNFLDPFRKWVSKYGDSNAKRQFASIGFINTFEQNPKS